jgi:hypothetical protein|tara:strand:+ start:587 stop:1270 length:684 start_codon:yes stop_codon:yes gene_type:complete
MNFNYSYKAFVITILILGNLYLLFYFIKLPSNSIILEEEYEIEYALEEVIPEEELASVSEEEIKIETHKVFNEDQKFIEELETDRKENNESTEDKLSEINEVISDSKSEIKDDLATEKKYKSNLPEAILATTNNSKSTNSYRLVNRKVIEFPNPVYVCDSFGKVVLHIEVNANGYVIMTSVNKNASTTTNLCLIESAIDYAKKARFTKDKNKPSQVGSITYIFPGQE